MAALVLTLGVASATQAATVTFSLGQSTETFTQYGQGIDGSGRGNFREGQGASTFDGTTSTFVLSGAILGGNTPGMQSGTYEFITTYLGAHTPQGGPNAPHGRTSAADETIFNYSGLDPSTRMTLIVHTPSGDFTHVFYNGSTFDGGFSFQIQSGTCTGLGALPCSQKNVGETPGSTLSGKVTISTSFDTQTLTPVPEPATWAMMILGFGMVGFGLRMRRRLHPV